MIKKYVALLVYLILFGVTNAYPNVYPLNNLNSQTETKINSKAYWIEINTCSVVLRTSIELNQKLQPNTPIDQLSSMPAICTSNVSGQNLVSGGVRNLIGSGHRITGISHQVTVLPTVSTDGKVELLISAIFILEKPQSSQASGLTR